MSFSFIGPIPPSIVIPHYAYLDVVVRYVPTPSSEMSIEYNLKIRQAIVLMSTRLRVQVRSSSYWSAFIDVGLRWSRINPCSWSNKLYCCFYCYFSCLHKHRQESKHWGNCWWCRWRSCPYRNYCWPNRFYYHAPSQGLRINAFHIHFIWITTNYDE